jgi:beta-glucosidase
MKTLKIALGLAHLLASSLVAAKDEVPIYLRAGAPVGERVHDLLSRMTLEEKIAQLESNWTVPLFPGSAAGIVKDGKIDEAVARRTLSQGLGTFIPLSFSGLEDAAAGATLRNAVQAWVMKNTRLHVPILFHGEGLHGAVMKGATCFPQAIGLGSTWDRALVKQLFARVARESRAAGVSLVLAPVFDLARDPRFGRVEEMYSEDPYLVGEMGLAAVQGLQGDSAAIDQDHVIATAKHFVHGQPENGTNLGPSDFSERTMRSVFLSPFDKAIKVGKIGALMPSYNENGGIPANADSWLLQDILRKEWGFTGLVLSDYLAVPELARLQSVAGDVADAGIMAFNAGVDMELPTPAGFPALGAAVRDGRVTEARIDESVTRVLTAKFSAGLFEQPFTDPRRTVRIMEPQGQAQLARQAADEAIVLLKNDADLLPLKLADIKTLAVIGPNADRARVGGYSGEPAYFVTVLEGIRKRVGRSAKVTYAEGVRISEPDASAWADKFAPYAAPSAAKDAALIAQAIATARAADAVVLVLGENETITREAFGTDFGDRPLFGDTDTLELPGRQNELVRELAKLGKPTVAVLLNGRPLSTGQLTKSVSAIVEGWYLGQETGNAVAGVLFGDTNPSGRLPVTIARNVGQLPVFYYRKPAARLGYVFDANAPLYPFGFGLSYTRFTYGMPVLDRAAITRDGTARVSVRVTNAGARAGDEVVQMYVHPKVSSAVQPILRLAGFERIHLEPGMASTVSFDVGPEQLAIWDRQMEYRVEAGTVDVMVGPNALQTVAVPLEVRP